MTRPVLPVFALLVFSLCAARPAVAGEAIEHAMSATFRVYAANASGTGFLVSVEPAAAKGKDAKAPAKKDDEAKDEQEPPAKPAKPQVVLVSAAHHFEKMTGEKATIVLRAKRDDGTYERREVEVDIRKGKKPLWTRHPEMDVAAIKVDLPAGVAARPIPLAQVADESFVANGHLAAGGEVWVPCFPSALEGNDAGWPVLRRASVASFPLAPLKAAKTILIDYPNFGGDSGAPVFAVDGTRPVVVSIVLGMHRQTERTSSAFEERTIHTPMAVSYTAQAPFVRQTIELLMK
ncbi:MAG TPA: hypothetical protein VF796_19140 [Humisphaera sp.]